MRPPHNSIFAPEFPHDLPWENTDPLTMAGLLGRPVLMEFWDFCRPELDPDAAVHEGVAAPLRRSPGCR